MRKRNLIVSFALVVTVLAGIAFSQTITRRQIGKQDLGLWDGVTSTFTYTTNSGTTLTFNSVGDAVDVLQVYGGGTDQTSRSLASAVSAIGTGRKAALLMAPGTWTMLASVAIPANLVLVPAPGANIVLGAYNLTVYSIVAGDHQVFTQASTGRVIGLPWAKPEWWGADPLGVSGSLDAVTDAMESIYASARKTELFLTGEYLIEGATGEVDLLEYVALRGPGGFKKEIPTDTIGILKAVGVSVDVEGIFLDGNDTTTTVPSGGSSNLKIYQASSARVVNVTSFRARGDGIYIGSPDDTPTQVTNALLVTGCKSYNNRRSGISLTNVSGAIVSNNIVWDNYRQGIDFEINDNNQGNDVIISNNVITNYDSVNRTDWGTATLQVTAAASDATPYKKRIIITGNVVDNNWFDVDRTGNTTIEPCVFIVDGRLLTTIIISDNIFRTNEIAGHEITYPMIYYAGGIIHSSNNLFENYATSHATDHNYAVTYGVLVQDAELNGITMENDTIKGDYSRAIKIKRLINNGQYTFQPTVYGKGPLHGKFNLNINTGEDTLYAVEIEGTYDDDPTTLITVGDPPVDIEGSLAKGLQFSGTYLGAGRTFFASNTSGIVIGPAVLNPKTFAIEFSGVLNFDWMANNVLSSKTVSTDSASAWAVGQNYVAYNAGPPEVPASIVKVGRMQFECILDHNPSVAATDKPMSGSAWETYWRYISPNKSRSGGTVGLKTSGTEPTNFYQWNIMSDSYLTY